MMCFSLETYAAIRTIVSLVALVAGIFVAAGLLGAVLLARHAGSLADAWRWVYAAGMVASLFFLVFVTVAQPFLKIGAKVVRHGRSVTFQMAAVLVPRQLFQQILTAIAALRPVPPVRC